MQIETGVPARKQERKQLSLQYHSLFVTMHDFGKNAIPLGRDPRESRLTLFPAAARPYRALFQPPHYTAEARIQGVTIGPYEDKFWRRAALATASPIQAAG